MREVKMLLVGFLAVFGYFGQQSDSYRILALFPLNSKSHQAMCDRLVQGLAAKGHEVDVYSHYPPKKPIDNYQHFSLEGTLDLLTNNMNYSMALKLASSDPKVIIEALGNPTCKLMELPIFQPLFGDRSLDLNYDLVIVETFIAECYLAWGRHLGVPMVGVMTNTMPEWYSEAMDSPINMAITPSLSSNIIPDPSVPMTFVQRAINAVLTPYGKFMFEQAMYEQNQMIKQLFGSDYPEIVELRRDLDLIIVNSHHSLENIRPLTPSILPSAGIHIDDEDETKLPEDIQKWLDDSKQGCVYVSFGSMIKLETFPWQILQAFYRTFGSISPVRVLLKMNNSTELPISIPSNVMIKPWFPQLQVLKHENTKAFITHGGMMSVLEAIHCAVPMVGIPIFGDQYYNILTNAKRGVAIIVRPDQINEKKLNNAVMEVLYNPWYKKDMDELSRKFNDRPVKPVDAAVYWVEYVARHGKKCLRSPVADIEWWKASLLDVYSFITLVVVILTMGLVQGFGLNEKIPSLLKLKSKKDSWPEYPIIRPYPKFKKDMACGPEDPMDLSSQSLEKAADSEEPTVSSPKPELRKTSKKKSKHFCTPK